MLLEGVGDVFEEDEAEDDVLVLSRIHVVAELVGGEPELGLEAEVGGGILGGRLGFRRAWHEDRESGKGRIATDSSRSRLFRQAEKAAGGSQISNFRSQTGTRQGPGQSAPQRSGMTQRETYGSGLSRFPPLRCSLLKQRARVPALPSARSAINFRPFRTFRRPFSSRP